MQVSIEKAINLKSTLDTFRPLDAETEARIMQKFRLDWNYHSNHIEGNTLTYGETKALILHGITAQGKPLKDHFEITGHNEAIDWVIDILKDKRPMTEGFIQDFHKILLKKSYEVDAITPDGKPTKKMVKVGEYKSTSNHVKTKTGEIFRFATAEETPAEMHDLMKWFREKEGVISPIILATEFHYRFIRIHPFDDGNGRVARLLMNFILMKNDFPPVIIKTENKEDYFSALRQADGGSIDAFIKFITENLVHSLELMILGAKGESVEDPDDVLKELKLIEKQIDQIAADEEREIGYSDRVFDAIVDQSFNPLFNEIALSLGEIGKVLEGGEASIFTSQMNDALIHNYHESSSFTHIGQSIKSIRAHVKMIIRVSYVFGKIKKLKNSDQTFNSDIEFALDKNVFRIFVKDKKAFEISYGSKVSDEQIKEISKALLKDFVAQISKTIKDFG